MLALVAGLTVRLYFLQVMSGEYMHSKLHKAYLRSKSIPAPRGNIYDRNGKLLVKSIPSPAVAVDPRIVSGNEEVLNDLVKN